MKITKLFAFSAFLLFYGCSSISYISEDYIKLNYQKHEIAKIEKLKFYHIGQIYESNRSIIATAFADDKTKQLLIMVKGKRIDFCSDSIDVICNNYFLNETQTNMILDKFNEFRALAKQNKYIKGEVLTLSSNISKEIFISYRSFDKFSFNLEIWIDGLKFIFDRNKSYTFISRLEKFKTEINY